MATKKKSTARITLRTVLEHMQKMHQDMLKGFDRLEKADAGIRSDMVAMERRLTRQIDGLDTRLDDIETKVLPALKKAVAAR